MGKIAIITGIAGQDGSYLAELLLKKNYKIYGICKKSKKINFRNIKKIKKKIFIKKIFIIYYQPLKNFHQKQNFIMQRPQNYLVMPNHYHNMRIPISIQDQLMVYQK